MSENTVLKGLTCEIYLPLRWSLKEVGSSVSGIHDHDSTNINRLHSILGLDDVFHHDISDELPSGVSDELQRIDFKINVVLEMVSKLIVDTLKLPPSVDIVLGATAMRWHSPASETESVPAEGSELEIELFLDERFPYSIFLTGQIVEVEPKDNGYTILMSFNTLSERVSELLEKYIFRCHRRHIARLKQAAHKNAGD